MSTALKTAVILLNMGGPDSLDAVAPFLRNLFSDPAILGMPAFVRQPLARLIAWRRAPMVVEKYREIGGKSPLREITEAQAAALERELGGREAGWSVHVAMRYWNPRAADAVAAAKAAGAERLVVLSLYPHYSRATTGSSLADLDRALEAEGLGALPRTVVRSWHDFPPYLDALAEAVAEGLRELPGATVLFSAHGLPVKLIEQGDPYLSHVQGTVAGVVERLPGVAWRLAFQSRTGPVRWLEPSTPDMIRTLAGEGVKDVLVVPVSFVSDHIETLHELDLEYGELARGLGLRTFRRCPSLNTRPSFLRALAALARG
jgi:ferrochelatase